ncbi:hypothetical protein FA15DRAFT_666549 [Coprinopsis marcescibilis]|uniref:RNI-like protein n=1 Tax=Coprinopsis marcescibilis TaxID=230819 RepID=A0A5C3L356_COPMA|nr:hypothetical protein FA15DRAFT_666549 [Coprinopsis marcescibilis]
MERADVQPAAPQIANLLPASALRQYSSTNPYRSLYFQRRHPQFGSPPLLPPPPSRFNFSDDSESDRLPEDSLSEAPHLTHVSRSSKPNTGSRIGVSVLVFVSNAAFSASSTIVSSVGELIKSMISIIFVALFSAFAPSISVLTAICKLPHRLFRDTHHYLPSLPKVSLASLRGRWQQKTRTFRPVPPGALNWRSSQTHTPPTTNAQPEAFIQQNPRPPRRTRGGRMARDQTPPPKTHAAPPLVKVDLKATLALGAKRNFQTLFQWFESEVEDPEYDAFVKSAVNSADDRAPPQREIHRLTWQGEGRDLGKALHAAFPCLVTDLAISNCDISVQDVLAILELCPALETLEVRQVADCQPVLPLMKRGPRIMSHPLATLRLTSRVPLDPIFSSLQFAQLDDMSLKLFCEGNKTSFLEIFRYLNSQIRSMKIRGNLTPGNIRCIEEYSSDLSGLDLDIGHVCESVIRENPPSHRQNFYRFA